MPWEIEVSNQIGSWGAYGKTFRPGIWTTDDERIAAAARNANFVTVREVDETGADVVYDTEPNLHGELTRADLQAAADGGFLCGDCDAKPYKTARARDAHRLRVHGLGPDDEMQPEEPEDEGSEGAEGAEGGEVEEAEDETPSPFSTDEMTEE